MCLPQYSVLMSVYKDDKPAWLREALDSMLAQTHMACEIVIVEDGPNTPELQQVLEEYSVRLGGVLRRIPIEQNVGLGAALNRGVQECRYEYIARMDADDIAVPTRCEKILRFLQENPELSLAGCGVDEFIGSPENVIAHVVLPQNSEAARKFAKRRVPIRHSSIIFKKSEVLRVGNYKPLRRSQEYDLVVRMLMANCKVSNYPETLLYMRVDDDFYKRRGGWKKAKMLASQRYSFYQYGFYHFCEFIMYACINIAVCMMPNGLRKWVYTNILRKK